MPLRACKSATIGLTAISLSLGLAYSAQADVLPVTNLQFNMLTNPLTQQKDFFNTVKPIGWSVGTAGAGGSLTYVGVQGSEGFTGTGGNIYPVYTNQDSRLPFPLAPTSIRPTAIQVLRTLSFRPLRG